ncbi:MAG: EamA family transporter [Phycisphaeraceae bacterium]|nr:EamA family transporter [Phycisphaeraceae bacterium]
MKNPVSPHNSGAWLVLGAALLWGTTGTAQSFAPTGFDPAVIGAARLLIGGLALLALAAGRGELIRLGEWPWRTTLIAAFFTASYQVCFFAGVARTGVAVGTIVGIGTAPIAGGLLGYFFRGERPGRRWGAATALAIGGCALLVLTGSDRNVQIDLFGLVLAIGAGISYAAYTLGIKSLLDTRPPNAVMAMVVCLGAAMLLPLVWGRELDWLWQPRSIAVVLHLGLLTMALSYWLFSRGLKTVQVATAVTLSLAEPMTAALLGVLVVGERLPLPAWIGLLLILSGLLLLALPNRRYDLAEEKA